MSLLRALNYNEFLSWKRENKLVNKEKFEPNNVVGDLDTCLEWWTWLEHMPAELPYQKNVELLQDERRHLPLAFKLAEAALLVERCTRFDHKRKTTNRPMPYSLWSGRPTQRPTPLENATCHPQNLRIHLANLEDACIPAARGFATCDVSEETMQRIQQWIHNEPHKQFAFTR